MNVLVTGGAGFIGSAVVRRLIRNTGHRVINVDKLTYAGNLESLEEVRDDPRHRFERIDIVDAAEVRRVFEAHSPDAVIHLAAESHVDRSIDGPGAFVEANVVGTYVLLHQAREHWQQLPPDRRDRFRFLHVSTDEVFGSLGTAGRFSEASPYRPSSPYAATKAGADHLVRAWRRTYGLPALITNSSNNYGPFQFPDKLIPLAVINALEGRPVPVYGQGEHVRDWLFVEDHAAALLAVLEQGQVGETYLVGGSSERTNLAVIRAVCGLLDELAPRDGGGRHADLIQHVADRPGHDRRYAVDSSKLRDSSGWRPTVAFEPGLRETVRWYVEHRDWWERARSGKYQGERLGLDTEARQ